MEVEPFPKDPFEDSTRAASGLTAGGASNGNEIVLMIKTLRSKLELVFLLDGSQSMRFVDRGTLLQGVMKVLNGFIGLSCETWETSVSLYAVTGASRVVRPHVVWESASGPIRLEELARGIPMPAGSSPYFDQAAMYLKPHVEKVKWDQPPFHGLVVNSLLDGMDNASTRYWFTDRKPDALGVGGREKFSRDVVKMNPLGPNRSWAHMTAMRGFKGVPYESVEKGKKKVEILTPSAYKTKMRLDEMRVYEAGEVISACKELSAFNEKMVKRWKRYVTRYRAA